MLAFICTCIAPISILFLFYEWMRYGTEYMVIHYRWIVVMLCLLPVSVIYDAVSYGRSWLVFKMNSAPHKHAEKVKQVQKQVRDWNKDGRKEKMCTARPGWQTISLRQGKYKKTMRNISINLIDILEIDEIRQIVRVEPLASMGQISATLIPLGWTLPIVPELDDLTVGGLINGVGVETSSFKYGLFQHICEAFEVVLADGSCVRCTKTENTDLFYAIPWSHGTLGFLVSAEIRIIATKKYVKVSYEPVYGENMEKRLEEEVAKKDELDYVEMLVYAKDKAVLMSGKMTDDAEPGKINEIGNFYKPWFFKHVESYFNKGSGVEYIPLRHYFHRHSRSLFWTMRQILPFGNNPLFRALFGWMVPPKVALLKLTTCSALKKMYEEHQLIQDMLVPIKYFGKAIKFFHEQANLYPLWICPFKLPSNPGMVHPPNGGEQMYVDIGAYGPPAAPDFQAFRTTRNLEKFVNEHDGFQMLYADSYLTRKEFQTMFDHVLYRKMRAELDCENAFPEIYEKVNRQLASDKMITFVCQSIIYFA